ncbi:hypothetical protein [Pleionea mediterranea]|uniref:hypothetical protein n=1 Tax=Pleionea mediterranea TaxID=523701 RepID=UPI001473F6E2|nr:hypothetical protein [Pleionea mediterranea]
MDASGSYCQPWKAVNNGVLIGMSDFEEPAGLNCWSVGPFIPGILPSTFQAS